MEPKDPVVRSDGTDLKTPSGDVRERSPDPPAVSKVVPAVRRLWPFALGAGLLAGIASWVINEAGLPFVLPKSRIVQTMGGAMDLPSFVDQVAADSKNATVAYGILGAMLGLALGVAGGLVRNSPRRGVFAGITGALLGAIGGVGGATVFLPIYFRQLDVAQEQLGRDLVIPLLVHIGTWAVVGVASGIALGLGLGEGRRASRAAFGGLIGGALGAVVYEVVGALVFPNDRTTQPIALTWGPRLLAALSVSLMIAVMAVSTIAQAPAQRAAERAPG
jgi:hypothetical protein